MAHRTWQWGGSSTMSSSPAQRDRVSHLTSSRWSQEGSPASGNNKVPGSCFGSPDLEQRATRWEQMCPGAPPAP